MQNHTIIKLEIASDELTLNEVVKTFATVTGKPTEIEGAFSSGTAEKAGLKKKDMLLILYKWNVSTQRV